MPTYVYRFVDTDETIEIQQSFTDPTLTEAIHPETGATMAVKKVFLPVGVTFKGDGFYKTDSRGTKPKAAGASTGGSESSSSSSESSSSSAGSGSGSTTTTGGSSSGSSGGSSGSDG